MKIINTYIVPYDHTFMLYTKLYECEGNRFVLEKLRMILHNHFIPFLVDISADEAQELIKKANE